MKKLDCGCEIQNGTLVSLCELHAAHERAVLAVKKLEAPKRAANKDLRDKLLVACASDFAPLAIHRNPKTLAQAAADLHTYIAEILEQT